jgi:hypothetical protein
MLLLHTAVVLPVVQSCTQFESCDGWLLLLMYTTFMTAVSQRALCFAIMCSTTISALTNTAHTRPSGAMLLCTSGDTRRFQDNVNAVPGASLVHAQRGGADEALYDYFIQVIARFICCIATA